MNQHSQSCLVVVVGPSGVGKDTLVNAAREHFNTSPDVGFVRRIITRVSDPDSEDHESVTTEEFQRRRDEDDFCIWWQANDLYYGLPVSVHQRLAKGEILIANGSRAALPDFRKKFAQLRIVHITASPEALSERLLRRNRESKAQVVDRLQRTSKLQAPEGEDVVNINNSGERQQAIDEFIGLVESLRTTQ